MLVNCVDNYLKLFIKCWAWDPHLKARVGKIFWKHFVENANRNKSIKYSTKKRKNPVSAAVAGL